MSHIKLEKKTNGVLGKIRNSIFYIKLTNWEFWPMYIANIPLVLTIVWFAIKSRKLFFFSAVNPVIETGGMWGESKYNILKRIPESHIPLTFFVKKGSVFSDVEKSITELGFGFPIIAKPDVGERGLLVKKIRNKNELENYLSNNKIDFLVQEFIDLPIELAVMHHRLPGEEKGEVTSVCIKEMMKIIGDGKLTVEQLMAMSPRAILQLERFRKTTPGILEKVPETGEVIELEPIGNHCRGTMFLNGNGYIDEVFTRQFDKVAFQMEGIYYGRFDLKCRSIEDLKKTGFFQVMEYNGIGAEPAHIYDPGYPVLKKYLDIFIHWKIIYKIYKIQYKKGYRGMSIKEAVERYKVYSEYQKQIKNVNA